MNHLIRRSSSVAASPAARQALSALLSGDILRASPSILSSRYFNGSFPTEDNLCFGSARRRGFHFSPALGLRASEIARAEYAVDELFDEDKGAKDSDEGLEIAKLGIAKEIVNDLARKGITKLFPIQRAVLEPAMQGRDMIGRAKTGTGKTLAFGIPIMDGILRFQAKNGRGRYPLAIVLAPTRELARQVEKEFRESSPLDTICVYGGVPIQQQMKQLDYGVDVVVGTPGRVIDLLKRGALNLSEVQFVVLDEADQMLNVGFAEDVEVILEKLPRKRQSMMFSATMPSWIRKLTQKYLNDPLTIDLVGESDQKLAEGISLYTITSDNYSKPAILGPLIKEHAKGGKCIVFTQTKRDADRLASVMGRSFGCEALHGDISQNQREKTLSGFRDGRFSILVATDVAARGLDIPNVDLVIHYELPTTSEIFVHRSGRTGRAGKKGSAVLIYNDEQRRAVRGIELDVGCKFNELPKITVEGGNKDLIGSMSGGSRFDSYGGGRMGGGSGFGRSGGFGGGSGYGSPRDFGGSSRFGGSSFGRVGGGYNDSDSNSRFGSSGGSDSRQSSGFGRSGGFGSTGSGSSRNPADSGFGSSGASGSGGSLGNSNTGRFESLGNSGLDESSGFGGSVRGGFGSLGANSGKDNRDDSWPRRF